MGTVVVLTKCNFDTCKLSIILLYDHQFVSSRKLFTGFTVTRVSIDTLANSDMHIQLPMSQEGNFPNRDTKGSTHFQVLIILFQIGMITRKRSKLQKQLKKPQGSNGLHWTSIMSIDMI